MLKVTGLSKHFGGVTAVDNVSFELKEGEFLGIIGPNGAGKTTLLNLITGFLKPDSGKVYYRGKNITALKPHKICELGMARTLQMVRPFYNLPAFKNVIIPLCSPRSLKFSGSQYGERDDIALDYLEEVGFERDSSVPYKPAGVLPHGYVKRLELARALAMQPDLLLLDELFSGMSMSEVASTMFIIERLRAKGMSIIMVEHRVKELVRVADRLLLLNFGAKIVEGKPIDVISSREAVEAYLGSSQEVE
ncbi:MAG: ABC transporter ATP-binding protein [Chloroflexi bacterium]|nr:ABC transporter ATP-binding protein [Chloroflexota bacterium]MBM3154194.1 ABC transporter ATP-binding protein [Chloroflexota bacterium]MBM3172839.1 ABC transporter ATP-binding protein [Chloroflexota bacterium]MBM3174545.1 ABC transporter ATP-binding protein [Chloroflexota bacterium]MBM4449422.1 ABC transporter ATP-binding protein [Chloroflexota bacterium]